MVNTGSVVVAPPKTRRTYRSPQRQARAHATGQRVLRAAATLFGERGYAGTTVRSVAEKARVSVPTVETLFGTKARMLKATIDVAIAGDDEPVPVLARDWVAAATATTDVETFLSIVASVLAPAQGRSSGLVVSVFEGGRSDPDLAVLAVEMSAQRATMAGWVVGRLAALGALHHELTKEEAVDTVFALTEPALFERLTGWRGWTLAHYEHWVARSLRLLLTEAGPRGPLPTRSSPS